MELYLSLQYERLKLLTKWNRRQSEIDISFLWNYLQIGVWNKIQNQHRALNMYVVWSFVKNIINNEMLLSVYIYSSCYRHDKAGASSLTSPHSMYILQSSLHLKNIMTFLFIWYIPPPGTGSQWPRNPRYKSYLDISKQHLKSVMMCLEMTYVTWHLLSLSDNFSFL